MARLQEMGTGAGLECHRCDPTGTAVGMNRRLPLALVVVPTVMAMLNGCGSVSTRPSRSGFRAEARPKGCRVEFLRRAPERDYVELGEMYSYFREVVEPENVLRETACELGADAVIVTRDFLVSHGKGPDHKLVAGIAIKYREPAVPGSSG